MKNEKYYYIRDGIKTSEDGLGRPVITVCLIKSGDEIVRGIAICSDKDQPRKRIGRAIARERANYALSVGKDVSVIGRWSLANTHLAARDFHVPGNLDFKSYFNPVLTDFEMKLFRRWMPITKMTCPKCNHAYNLPSDEAKRGFIRCPKCGYKAEDEKER